MKKGQLIILSLLIIFSISQINALPDPKESIQDIKNNITSFNFTKEISDSKFFGPINKALSNEKIQLVFQIPLAHKYELSFNFFFILILWIIIWNKSHKIIKASNFIEGKYSIVQGLLIAVILAQARVFYLISNTIYILFTSQESLLLRILILIGAIWLVTFLYILLKIFENSFTKSKSTKLKEELQQELSEVKALNKGLRG